MGFLSGDGIWLPSVQEIRTDEVFAIVRKDLSVRWHECGECGYVVDRDIASAQKICNRGIETYRGTPEKQEIGSQVVLSGNLVLDKWRNLPEGSRGARSIGDDGNSRSTALR